MTSNPPPPAIDDFRDEDGSVDWLGFKAAAREWAEAIPVEDTDDDE